MRILLTGGAGFIGSNLTDFLVNKGNTVIVIDDLSTGKLENLSIHLENRDIDFIESRVEDVDLNAFSDIDGVIHLAAHASVPLSVSDFRNSSSTNLLSSLNIINYCVINELPLVYASSSAVYGDLEKGNDQSKEVIDAANNILKIVDYMFKVENIKTNTFKSGFPFEDLDPDEVEILEENAIETEDTKLVGTVKDTLTPCYYLEGSDGKKEVIAKGTITFYRKKGK